MTVGRYAEVGLEADARIAQLTEAVEDRDRTIAELRARIAELEPVVEPTELERRNALTLSEYKPGRGTAGLLSDVPRVPLDGVRTFTASGSELEPLLVENFDFRDQVKITGRWIRFRNCDFSGSPTLNVEAVKAFDSSHGDLWFEDCRVWAQSPKWGSAGFKGGYRTTYLRCEITGVIDGIVHINPLGDYKGDQAMRVLGCWFHDMAMISPDPGTTTEPRNISHTDLIQWRGGSGLVIFGCNLDGFCDPAIGAASEPSRDHVDPVTGKNVHDGGNLWYSYPEPQRYAVMSVLMCSPMLGQLNGVLVAKNWIDGGIYSINWAGTRSGKDLQVVDNVWGRGMRAGTNATQIAQVELPITITGNTFPDGAPANMRKRG